MLRLLHSKVIMKSMVEKVQGFPALSLNVEI